MQAWYPDGPNVVTVPEGVAELRVVPVVEFIRRPPGLGAYPTHLDPKPDEARALRLHAGEPVADDEGRIIEPRPLFAAGPLAIDGRVVEISERLRITGVRVYRRCDRAAEGVAWEVIAEFEIPEGRARADEDLRVAQAEHRAKFGRGR